MNFQQIRTLNRLAEDNERLKAAVEALEERIKKLEPKRGRPRKNETNR